MYRIYEDKMEAKKAIVATTFNMSLILKEKAQIHIAKHNRLVKESKSGDRINLGAILNKALKEYLEKADK